MANYLDSEGNRTYEEIFVQTKHSIETKKLAKHQDMIGTRNVKKLKMISSMRLERELDEQITGESSTAQPKQDLKSIPINKTIFEEGVKLHDQYKSGSKLISFERKRMSSGLSGILDLVEERNGQPMLFTKDQWDKIYKYYTSKHKLVPTRLSLNNEEKWKNICSKSSSKSILRGQQYVDKICSMKDVDRTDYKTYKLFGHLLDMVADYQHILNPTNLSNLTEGDYTYQIWLGIFNKLFAIGEDNRIRLKTGESILHDSTSDKIMLYGEDSAHLIGFKVNIRFIYDHQNQEYDLCDMEMCLNNENTDKLHGDQGKLSREGKTNTSILYQICDEKSHVRLWVIQAFGQVIIYFATTSKIAMEYSRITNVIYQ